MKIFIKRKFVIKIFIFIIIFLMTAHVCGWVVENVYEHKTHDGLVARFNIDMEKNVPTWYSSSAILVCALLLAIIGIVKKKANETYSTHWIILAVIFTFLSCDEAAMLHEMTVSHTYDIIGHRFFRKIGWVIPYSILLIVFLVSYLRFFFNLPKSIKLMFIGSFAMYVGGALGIELITAALGDFARGKLNSLCFHMLEEIFEMGGMVFFIHTLLCYISWYVGEISICIIGNRQIEKDK